MSFEQRLIIEEVANSITHGIGLILSLVGFFVLIALTLTKGSMWHFVGCGVYGATMVILYAASTLYHSVRQPRLKHIFLQVDQMAIYLLIAGTYTPFMLVNLRGFWGLLLLTLVWALSIFGIVFKIIYVDRYKSVTMSLYLLTAWAALLAVKPIIAAVPMAGLAWIAAGGLAYMLGLVFFAWDRVPFNHTIWHVFVLAGSACHFLAVIYYVLPAGA